MYSESKDTTQRRVRVGRRHDLQRRLGVRGLLRTVGHLNFLPLGLRWHLINALHDPEYAMPHLFETDFFGFRYQGTLDSFIDWNVYFFGAYERQNLLLLRDLLKERSSPVFLDVGANVGEFSLFLSRYSAQVHAFEPWDRVRTELQRKINLNGVTNVAVHGVGLSEKDDSLPFYAPLGANKGTGSFNPEHAPDRNRESGILNVANGDSYLRAKQISKVDLIKIDVEGWERSVLLGLTETLERERPIIFLEFSESTMSTFAGEADFRACIPEKYRTFFVKHKKGKSSFEPFDANRQGDVLLIP